MMFATEFVSVTGNWLSVVVLLGTILGGLWRVWAKTLKPYIKAQEEARARQAEESAWVRVQMEPNGIARLAGTINDTLRDSTDRNMKKTNELAQTTDELAAAIEKVRVENARALAEVAALADKRHEENQAAIRGIRETGDK